MASARRIHLCLAKMSGLEEAFIKDAFATNWVAPLGPNVDSFEELLEQYLGEGRSVAAVSSGTSALHLSLVMLGVERDDEVICQSMTFAASANPILYQGARPVFVDSEEETWNMSPSLLREAIVDRLSTTGRKPKAIIAVDLYGMPANFDALQSIAQEFEIPMVEDAAEALGSQYCRQQCGTFGDYGVLSFNGNKMITTSGGGAIVCPTEDAKRRAIFLATQARAPQTCYHHETLGYNYRLSNISAGIGCGQMGVLDQHIEHHKELALLYHTLLQDVAGLSVHLNPLPEYDSNYWLTTILIDRDVAGVAPEDVRRSLEGINVESRPLWKPMHLQPLYSDAQAYTNGVSEKLFNQGLCLPSGPWVTPDDVEMIATRIKTRINGII